MDKEKIKKIYAGLCHIDDVDFDNGCACAPYIESVMELFDDELTEEERAEIRYDPDAIIVL